MIIIELILKAISPDLRKAIIDFIIHLGVLAEATPNPLDNVAVSILKVLFGIKE